MITFSTFSFGSNLWQLLWTTWSKILNYFAFIIKVAYNEIYFFIGNYLARSKETIWGFQFCTRQTYLLITNKFWQKTIQSKIIRRWSSTSDQIIVEPKREQLTPITGINNKISFYVPYSFSLFLTIPGKLSLVSMGRICLLTPSKKFTNRYKLLLF